MSEYFKKMAFLNFLWFQIFYTFYTVLHRRALSSLSIPLENTVYFVLLPAGDRTRDHAVPLVCPNGTIFCTQVNAIYVFDVEGEGQWYVDMTSGSGSVGEGDPPNKPDVTVVVNKENFLKVTAFLLFFVIAKNLSSWCQTRHSIFFASLLFHPCQES